MHRDCPRWDGWEAVVSIQVILGLGESEWGQTRAQLTRSTPTQALQRSQQSVPQIYQAGEEESPPAGQCRSVQCRFPVIRYVRANEYSDTPYLIIKNASQHQMQVEIFNYLLCQQDGGENQSQIILNRKLNFRECTCYRQRHTATVITTDN